MREYFLITNSFAAPFFSDSSEYYVQGEEPLDMLERAVKEYNHPAGLYAADQGSLWNEGDVLLSETGSTDKSSDIHDAYESKKEDINEWMKDFQSLFDKPIVGVVAELDGELFADISDTIEFAKAILPQVVKGYCLDAIVSRVKKELPLDEDRIVSALENIANGKLISGDSPNKVGKDIRIKSDGSLSSIFCYKKEIVHWVIVKA